MGRLTLGQGLAAVATVCVVAVVVAALSLLDSPDTTRAKRIDAYRAQDLAAIARALDCYWTLEGEQALPADLAALAQRIDAAGRKKALPRFCQATVLADRETGASYGYRVIDGAQYELCATFALASEDGHRTTTVFGGATQRDWRHDAGEHCFTLTARKVSLPGITDD